ncbi:hypothetical protein [Amycolatopsis plumensis]|uniref:Uncharacterized protein n=1 Tax=Amycolatopsis plumensis TaxID=236508 RepID=A0ABV5U403_9PSEU
MNRLTAAANPAPSDNAQRVDTVTWTLPADAPPAQLEATMETLLHRDSPGALADEFVTDDTSTPTGFETLVATVRKISTTSPTAVSEAFAAVAADHTAPAKLDELLYAHRGAGRALADRLQQHGPPPDSRRPPASPPPTARK